MLGTDLVDPRGDAVVESPTGTGADDQQRVDGRTGTRLPHQQQAGNCDQTCGCDHGASEVLAKHRRCEQDREHQLEIEQQRRGRRRCVDQPGHQQRRADGATGDDRHRQPGPIAPERGRSRRLYQPPRRDRQRSTEIQQAGEQQRCHVFGDERRRGRRRTEQQRGKRTVANARPAHGARIWAASGALGRPRTWCRVVDRRAGGCCGRGRFANTGHRRVPGGSSRPASVRSISGQLARALIKRLTWSFSWSGRRNSNPRPSPWQGMAPGDEM